MRQTKERESNCRLAVDIEGLAAMLSCGQMTARKIAEDAGARITIGRRVGSPSAAGYCIPYRKWKNTWKQ